VQGSPLAGSLLTASLDGGLCNCSWAYHASGCGQVAAALQATDTYVAMSLQVT